MATTATRGGQTGNKNAEKPRIWSDALRKYAVQNPKEVAKAAETLWKKAAEGDVQAAREIADRMEGKPTQSIDAKVDASVTVELVRFDEDKAPG